ncbi:MAG: hypothetical protein WB438_05445 [Candidatus Cybelea sp.]
MDEPKDENEADSGAHELRKAGPTPTPSEVKEAETQPEHGHNAASTSREHGHRGRRNPPWTDRLQAWSAVVQAVCAAFILVATAFNALATFQIRDITNKYAGYTRRQADAEATSAAAAKISAIAEATEAADETVAANAATAALAGQQSQATTENAHFQQELATLIAGSNAQVQVARGTEANATAANGTLGQARHQLAIGQKNFLTEQRPFIFVNVPGFTTDNTNYGFDAQLNIANYGRSAAEHIEIARDYSWGPNAARAADDFFTHIEQRAAWKSWGSEPRKLGHG